MKAAAVCVLGLTLAGCQAVPPKAAVSERARFFLEASGDPWEVVILPQSGAQIAVQPKPVFTELDIVNVEIAQVELGQCLVFQFTSAAARDLARLTAANPDRRLVLTLGGVPFGARHYSRPLDRGVLFIFVEVPDAALPALVASLKETCAALLPAAVKR